jgi:hypothetical protein
LSLKRLDYLSRSQIQTLHRLGGPRNANRVLKGMEEYLSSFRENEKIYYLNKEGRLRVNSEKICKKTPQVIHYVMRNWLFIALGCPATWQNEIKLSVKNEVTVIADAIFSRGDVYNIIEVDYSQKMLENKEKIKRYKYLFSLNVLKKPPKMYWITTTTHRKKQLLSLCEGIDTTVYLVSDFN